MTLYYNNLILSIRYYKCVYARSAIIATPALIVHQCFNPYLIGLTIVINILQVPGKFELKGHDRVRGLSSLNVHNENQYMPGQSRNNTYVSRLQVI